MDARKLLIALAAIAATVTLARADEPPQLSEPQWSARIAAEWTAAGVPTETEVPTPDGKRCDLLTATHAWEVEWAAKQWQAPGQALYYAAAHNRQPAVLLLMTGSEADKGHYRVCLTACTKAGIRLETYRVDRAPPLPDPEPVDPEPEPPVEITEASFVPLGDIFFPPRLPEDTAKENAKWRQFAYTDGIACLTPAGTLIAHGHEHGYYAAELRLPEPSTDAPAVAEYVQTFQPLVSPEAFAAAGLDGPRLRGLLCADVVDDVEPEVVSAWGRHYNVARKQFPSLAYGPRDLARTAAGSPLLWVEDAEGVRLDVERVGHPFVQSRFGLCLVNQGGKYERSFGPALAKIAVEPSRGVLQQQLLFYPRDSRAFPYPLYADGSGGWNDSSAINGYFEVGEYGVFVGRIALGLGLENFQPYTEGSITVANGVVTLTGGTFPEWVGHLRFAGTGRDGDNVESRDSDTQVTLATKTLNAAAGTAYAACYGPRATSIYRNQYYGGPYGYPVTAYVDKKTGLVHGGGPGSKGYHAPPYELRAYVFKLADLANAADPSEPRPVAVINLSRVFGFEQAPPLGSVLYDSNRTRLYLIFGGSKPRIAAVQLAI